MQRDDHFKILVADDVPQNVELLRAMLAVAGHEVITACSGEEVLARVESESPDLVIVDAMMPTMDGYVVCMRLKEDERTRLTPVILATSAAERREKIRAIEAGSDYFLERPVDRAELVARVEALARTKRLNDELVSLENAIMALAIAIEAKDPYTEGHIERVASYAVMLGARSGLSERELELLRKGSILHDVGKIGVRESVLLKPGPLSEEEREHMSIHPVVGARICQPLRSQLILDMVRHHHERFDGSGYPDGLAGDKIPLAARIMALADAYDALTSDRPYRKRLSQQEALGVICQEAGEQFDPELVPLFIGLL